MFEGLVLSVSFHEVYLPSYSGLDPYFTPESACPFVTYISAQIKLYSFKGTLYMTSQPTQTVNAYTIDGDLFKVLKNDEGQYSLWPAKKATPAGWIDTGFTGSKVEATEYVDRAWTDMRPLSLQKAMAAHK